MSNAKKGLGNIASNILSQVVTLALGLIIPRLVIVNLGSESNGLLNTVTQVLSYVALLEAGVGMASLQSLYGPAANDDHDGINSILAATDHFYKRTGAIYFATVLLLSFVFPFTLKTELPRFTVMAVMFLSGIPGAINYFFQGKLKLLLRAEGKSYITTNLATFVHILTNVSKIILLLNGFDIVALQLMYLVFNVAQMLFIVIYIKRHYKWLDLSVKPDYDAISQSKNALVHQVSGLIFNNTDALILTYFCGLKTVSVYSMYVMLFGMVETMISNFNGIEFALGQTFNSDRARYLRLHDLYEIFNMTLTFSLFCIANIFVLPFMKIYTAGISDINYVDEILPILFAAKYLLSNGRNSSLLAISFGKHFRQTQWHAVIESVINITVSLLAVWKFGIYGCLVGTVAALLFRTNIMIIYASKKILGRDPWITYRRWILNLAIFVGFTILARFIFRSIGLNSYLTIILWAALSAVIIVPSFFVIVFLFDKDTFRFAKEFFRPYLNKILHR